MPVFCAFVGVWFRRGLCGGWRRSFFFFFSRQGASGWGGTRMRAKSHTPASAPREDQLTLVVEHERGDARRHRQQDVAPAREGQLVPRHARLRGRRRGWRGRRRRARGGPAARRRGRDVLPHALRLPVDLALDGAGRGGRAAGAAGGPRGQQQQQRGRARRAECRRRWGWCRLCRLLLVPAPRRPSAGWAGAMAHRHLLQGR